MYENLWQNFVRITIVASQRELSSFNWIPFRPIDVHILTNTKYWNNRKCLLDSACKTFLFEFNKSMKNKFRRKWKKSAWKQNHRTALTVFPWCILIWFSLLNVSIFAVHVLKNRRKLPWELNWLGFHGARQEEKKTTEKPTISLIVSNRHRFYLGTALTLFKFKLQLHKWLSRRIVEYWMEWKKKIQFICHDLFKQSSNHRGDDSIKAERKFAICSVKWVYFPVSFDFWLKCGTIENCRSKFRRLFIY